MADLNLIESNIVSNLQTITALKNVYDHEPKSLSTLPAATIFFDGFSQSDSASRRKSVDWRWTLRVYVRIQDAEQAQADIKNLMVEVRKALASDPSLGGNCNFNQITRGEVFVSLDQNNVHVMGEMTLTANTYESY
ncbi:hypothetical protein [Terrihalobacillus insolitus]|uniref:hypothetical protein n=1 Tax=Terrihalobacillus insolitus TaxID=2950438 RepID=UPI00234125EA|nr:hypothetical protein [Terrihalobacillus insolitus]MDC3414268.1 hypothetical protein [Terrihalobacillus insolitus]